MKLSARQRWMLWGALLMAGLGLNLWGDRGGAPDATAVVQAVQPASSLMEQAASAAEVQVAKVGDLVPREQLIRQTPATPVDLFSVRNWNPPLPPPPVQAAPPPVAPPLPFVLLGKKQQAGRWEVYLMQGEDAFIATEGATLQGVYVVQKIQPPNMTLTYRPLGQQQTLFIGE